MNSEAQNQNAAPLDNEAQEPSIEEGIASDAKVATAAVTKMEQAAESRREISSIGFPYISLEDAEEGAKALYSHGGTTLLTQPQCAAAMEMSQTSSAFRGRLAAMKMFGLMEYDQGRVQLTELGRAIADPHTALDARVDAFLRVPLYAKYAAQHDGHMLPKAQALEAEFISLGVAKKQADRARQVFERSARHANFVKPGTSRFVRPVTSSRGLEGGAEAQVAREAVPRNDDRTMTGGGSGGMDGGSDLDPVVRALVQKIPPPGSPWGVDEQVMWLRMMAMAFGMAYGGKRAINIQPEPEAKT